MCWLADGSILSASAAEDPSAPSPSVNYVDPSTAQAWLEDDQRVTFLDVRVADEFAGGHLPAAINIPYDQVAMLRDQLPYDTPIVLYCIHSAHRAPQAARTLHALGFDNVHVLEGGIVAWQAGGLSIRASDLAQAPTILPYTERCAELTVP
jgi:rhodanese-related sulfurtransferase